MKIIDIRERSELLKRGKSFNDLVDKEKIQRFMSNFCHAYSSFYRSDLVKSWRGELELSEGFVDYYRECRKKIGRDFYKTVLSDYGFRSGLYGTVKAWVSKAPFGGSKLKSFSNFYKAIEKIADDLEQVKEVTLESLVEKGENFPQIKEILENVFGKLRTADQIAQLVCNSKTLFHLLPDLIMPVDKKHVLGFFIGRNSVPRKKEIEYFTEIFDYYYRICKKNFTQIKSIYYKKRGRHDSSIPKIIDNAICGYTVRS